ncbi:hypothetical protein BCR44DRAFT_39472, partial [Catenaria anguillulae PL171]
MTAAQPQENNPSAQLERPRPSRLAAVALALISLLLPVIDHMDYSLRTALRIVTLRPRPTARIMLPGNGKQAVVISGATSGIGLDAAVTLASQDVVVFACGPDKKQVAKLAPYPQSLPAGALVPVILDVTDKQSIDLAVIAVRAELAARGPDAKLLGIISNAGILSVGQVSETDQAEMRRVFDVNTFGAVAFTKAFLPLVQEHGQGGRILVTSSMAKDLIFPVYSAYVASKHALEALFVSLKSELEPKISVSIMRPGGMETSIVHNYVDRTSSDPSQWRSASQGLGPEHTTRAIVHAMTSRAPLDLYRVGLDCRMAVLLKHLLTPGQLNELGNPHKQ